MRWERLMVVAMLLSATLPHPLRAAGLEAQALGAAVPLVGPAYRIGPGDLLNIEVWKDPSLTRSATVLPDGKIAYPMIGETMAAGKTVAELKKEISDRISAFVKDAVVTVEVRQVNSLQIYVLGEVKMPGRVNITSNIDVLQALAAAGGFGIFAKRSKIRIIRREEGKTIMIPFDYDDVVSGKSIESNILLRRGDVVLVP